jgi:hypothetical protein
LNPRQALFLEGPIPRALLTLAVPIILANLLQTGYQLTDAFWVGRLGAAAVAAISVSFPVTFLVIALGSGLSMAGATLAAQYMGAGRQELVRHFCAAPNARTDRGQNLPVAEPCALATRHRQYTDPGWIRAHGAFAGKVCSALCVQDNPLKVD